MKYAMFIHQKPGYVEALAEDAQKAVFAEYMALAQDPRARGGEQLQPIETATTVRVQTARRRPPTARTRTPRRSSAATTCSRRTTSTRRSSWRRGSRRPVTAV